MRGSAREGYTFIEVVQYLNGLLYDKAGESDNYFTYETDGNVDAILFNGHVLWCSEEDTRTTKEAISLDGTVKFLTRRYNKYVKGLPKL